MTFIEKIELVNNTEPNTISQFYNELLNTKEDFAIIYDSRIIEGRKLYTTHKYGKLEEIKEIYKTYEKMNKTGFFNYEVLKIDNEDIKWLEVIISTSLSKWIEDYKNYKTTIIN